MHLETLATHLIGEILKDPEQGKRELVKALDTQFRMGGLQTMMRLAQEAEKLKDSHAT